MENAGKLALPGLSRRSFLSRAGAGTGVLAAALANGCGGSGSTTPTPPPPVVPLTPDMDLLNFVLNLQYLEAEFYLRAATGQGLAVADAGTNAGSVTGGTQVSFATPAIQEYALELAGDELLHVRFLRNILASAAVSRPAIDLTNGFNVFAQMSGIGSTFNPFADEMSFVVGAFFFEDLIVTALHGAATTFTSKSLLLASTGVMAIDAYHAGEIRTLVSGFGAPYLTYANQISTLRATLGGGNETPVSGYSIVAEDNDCAAWQRTTDQVLHVVYATGAGVVSKGGFFPNGMSGTITATAN